MKSPVWFSIAFLAVIVTRADGAKPDIGKARLTAPEKWVLERVAAGKVANLTDEFVSEEPEEEIPLRADFLKDLLTGAFKDVKPIQYGVRIKGAVINEEINLENMRIPYEVRLEHCIFRDDVSFRRASFSAAIVFDGSTFNKEADFPSVKVGDFASFRKVTFDDAADFRGAEITGDFTATAAEFQYKDKKADFELMNVQGALSIESATFQGGVSFRYSRIGTQLDGVEAQFQNEQDAATFSGMKVGTNASFATSVFRGPVDFDHAEIGQDFVLDDADFRSVEKAASFVGMKVGRSIFLRTATFKGTADFDFTEIVHDFVADEAHFESKTDTVTIDIKCGHRGFFIGTTFAGPVSFASSNFLDLGIGHMQPESSPAPKIDLSRSLIKRELHIQDIRTSELVARSLRVEGDFDLLSVDIPQAADLSNSEVGNLDVSKSKWPKNPAKFDMTGMTYKYLRAADKQGESHLALLEMAGHARYGDDVYRGLEEFFSRQGDRDDADEVFIAGKRRERDENLHGSSWFGSLLLDWLVGYGRHPWQAGVPCAFFIVLGSALFLPSKMEVKKAEDANRNYNPFWYSLGLFLPFVNLQSAEVWRPKNDRWFLRHYMRIHILLGWILIPILLAAISGLIK